MPIIMPIINYCLFESKILIHKKCNKPVEKGFYIYYSCPTCDAWIHPNATEWKKQIIT